MIAAKASMPFHKAAGLFPLLEGDEFAALVADIRENGQLEEIITHEGSVLDGRNRYRACLEIGAEPRTREWSGRGADGDECSPFAYVWSLNGARRDIEPGRKAAIRIKVFEADDAWMAEKERAREAANRARSERQEGNQNARREKQTVATLPPTVSVPRPESTKTRTKIAKAAGVSPRTVQDALSVRKADEGLFEKVAAGEITIPQAKREIKRREVVANLEEVAVRESAAPPASRRYSVLVIDPPWPIEKIERDCRPNQVELDYPTMTLDEIRALDVPGRLLDDAHVWIWTTHRFLPSSFGLLEAWGLKYVCTFTWHKPGGFQPVGLPQYNCEFALYARRGSPQFVDTKALPVCFEAPRGAHSEKPEAFYETIRRVTGGLRLDWFNRRYIEGFDVCGKEAAHG